MQQIKVVSVETKKTKKDKSYYVLTDGAGAEFSTFDPLLLNAKPGDIVECEIEINGQFVNLVKGFKIIPATQPAPAQTTPVPQPPVRSYGKSAEELVIERRSIERQTALKMAVDFCTAPDEVAPHVCEVAEYFYQWISTGKKGIETKQVVSTPTPKVESATVTKPQTQSDKDFETLQSEGTPKLPEFKTADEMLRFACNVKSMEALKLKPWTWTTIQKTLGIKMPADIKDMSAVSKVLFSVREA